MKLTAGSGPLAAGILYDAAGRWPLAACRWQLAAGRWPWQLVVCSWQLAAGISSAHVFRYSLCLFLYFETGLSRFTLRFA